MSRPSRAAGIELERLECAAGQIARAQDLAGIVAIRLRQVQRRAPGLQELLVTGQAQLTALADALDEAHTLVSAVLDKKAAERHDAHFGEETEP
jgi:hypothetical protein